MELMQAANDTRESDVAPAPGSVGLEAGHTFPLPHILEAVAAVRHRARTVLADWDLSGDALDEALLVVSELITNAVVHALPPAVLHLGSSRVDGRRALHIEVTDGGAAPRPHRPLDDLEPDEHGRGLGIVTALSARHGTRVHRGRVTRWAELPVG